MKKKSLSMLPQLIQTKDQLETKRTEEHYDVKRVLGEGSYGKVYLVHCKRTRQSLALKCICKEKVSFKDFKRELNYSYFLSAHPNVITTYSVAYQTKDFWIFLQEYSRHGDLLNSMSPGLGLGVQPTKLIIKQVASALGFMHSKQICHRDVKPENILIFNKENWLVKIVDFGLSCRVDTVVRRSSGQTPYTPPEICDRVKNEGFHASTATDVWQTGITMFCLLTGTFPWDVANKTDKAYYNYFHWSQRKTAHPPARWAQFSKKLQKLFKKMLHHKKDERSSISVVNKYVDCVWISSSAASNTSGSSYKGDIYDDLVSQQAKQELQNKLLQHGIPTTVSQSLKEARINDWIDSIQFYDVRK